MISEAIFERLGQVVAVTDIFGRRFYPGEPPEGTDYPIINWKQISSGSSDTRSILGPAKLFRTLQQLDLRGRNRNQLDLGAAAIRTALDDQHKKVWGGKIIRLSSFDDQFDLDFEPDPNLHRIIQQYRIVYLEG